MLEKKEISAIEYIELSPDRDEFIKIVENLKKLPLYQRAPQSVKDAMIKYDMNQVVLKNYDKKYGV